MIHFAPPIKRKQRPFMPSNGTEGRIFERDYCDKCKRDDIENDVFCSIHTKALMGEQPAEWVYNEKGHPTCTAWKDPVEPEKTTTEIFKDMQNLPFKNENIKEKERR